MKHQCVRKTCSYSHTTGEGKTIDGFLPFHKFGREKIYSRFSRLRAALSGCPHLKLQNSLSSPGAFAWIHCDGEGTCEESFDKVNLKGGPGTQFGTTDNGECNSLWFMMIEWHDFLHPNWQDKGRLQVIFHAKSSIEECCRKRCDNLIV
jgi:hypothetical protein